jgi:hypothetical protein
MFSTTKNILMNKVISHIYYKQITTWAFPYWPGYHPETIYYILPTSRKETPILARRAGPIWASVWKLYCSNPITGYFPGV